MPPADAVEVLAAVLRDRSNQLARLAGDLEHMAEALWTEEGRQDWLASDE